MLNLIGCIIFKRNCPNSTPNFCDNCSFTCTENTGICNLSLWLLKPIRVNSYKYIHTDIGVNELMSAHTDFYLLYKVYGGWFVFVSYIINMTYQWNQSTRSNTHTYLVYYSKVTSYINDSDVWLNTSAPIFVIAQVQITITLKWCNKSYSEYN